MASSSSRLSSALSLIAAAIGIVFVVVFLFTELGATPMIIAGVAGLVAIVLGAVGLRKAPNPVASIIGIVLGALLVLVSAGLFIFAVLLVSGM